MNINNKTKHIHKHTNIESQKHRSIAKIYTQKHKHKQEHRNIETENIDLQNRTTKQKHKPDKEKTRNIRKHRNKKHKLKQEARNNRKRTNEQILKRAEKGQINLEKTYQRKRRWTNTRELEPLTK